MFQVLNLANMFPLKRKSAYTFLFYSQLDALFTLKLNSTMHILNNYRPVQSQNSRMVMDSFKAPPTTSTSTSTATKPSVKGDDGIALKISNAVLLLMLFGALFLH